MAVLSASDLEFAVLTRGSRTAYVAVSPWAVDADRDCIAVRLTQFAREHSVTGLHGATMVNEPRSFVCR